LKTACANHTLANMQFGVFARRAREGARLRSAAPLTGAARFTRARPVLLAMSLVPACTPTAGPPDDTDASSSTTSNQTSDEGSSSSSSAGPVTTTVAMTTGEPASSSSGEPGSTSEVTTTGPAPVCGDGVQDPGEACDDGDDDDTDECLASCELPVCGDGHVQVGVEACDDGNEDDGDGCSNACALASCGDGQVDGAEACDDGNRSDGDGCLGTCVLASCGDGFVHFGVEACDDGGASVSCNADCSLAACGDNIVNNAAGEACDEGEMTALCDADCTLAECGDSTLSPLAGEECDDGNLSDNDDCSSECKKLTRTIFVTSELYTGNLGGIAGADLKCQELAEEAGLPGVFYAWLSDGAIAPSNRFVKSSVPYVLATGIMVAKNWTDLTDGMILHAIDTTESKGAAPIPPSGCAAGKPTVWTNTLEKGTPWNVNGCDGWSKTTGAARQGNAKATNLSWSKFCEGLAGSCAWKAALYCVEQ
jgi:cysteine-rich repeat protein